jgi:hypothetical protein
VLPLAAAAAMSAAMGSTRRASCGYRARENDDEDHDENDGLHEVFSQKER